MPGLFDEVSSKAPLLEELRLLSEEERGLLVWDRIVSLQGETFRTSGRGPRAGVDFTYRIVGREMFIDRKSKSITQSSVLLSLERAIQVQESEGRVSGPKKIGTFGASYLYPIFLRLGLITSGL